MADEKMIAEYESRDGQSIKLSFDIVRRFLISGKANLVTDQEIMLYIATCKARGLNPFKRDCYLVKYTEGDTAATIVSIDYFRSRAKAQPDCAGWKCGIIVQDKDGEIQYRKGSFMIEGEKLLGGWFRAKPQGWDEEYEWSISLAPYVKKTGQGQVTRFWSVDNQSYMIAKVAESQGLRRVWTDEFQDLHIEEELLDARDVSPEPLRIPGAASQAKKEEKDDGQRNLGDDKGNPQNAAGGLVDEGPYNHDGLGNPIPPTKKSEKGQTVTKDRKSDALKFCRESTDKDWTERPKNWLETIIKGMNSKDQLEIARAHNDRNQAIKAAEGAPDA